MNLRQVNEVAGRSECIKSTYSTSVPYFANVTSIIGNIGEDLDHGSIDNYTVDEDEILGGVELTGPANSGVNIPTDLEGPRLDTTGV